MVALQEDFAVSVSQNQINKIADFMQTVFWNQMNKSLT